MADLSLVFDPSDMASKIAQNSAKASDASSAVAARSAIWDLASAASSRIAESSANWNKASDASSKASQASSRILASSAGWDTGAAAGTKAAAASSRIAESSNWWDKASSLNTTVIKSIPGTDSRAVHEIIYTSKSSIKYIYSSNAA